MEVCSNEYISFDKVRSNEYISFNILECAVKVKLNRDGQTFMTVLLFLQWPQDYDCYIYAIFYLYPTFCDKYMFYRKQIAMARVESRLIF
jgi:hypothetical protein